MIKRILVALDPDSDTPVATQYAIEMARRHGAEVSGLAVVDLWHIATSVGPGGAIGSFYYAEKVRHGLTEEARATAQRLVAAFDATVEEAGIRHGEHVEEGVSSQQIIDAMQFHDLLVMGGKAHFHYERPEEETKTVSEIVKHGVVPTLIVGEDYAPVERAVVAFDGSAAAARTLQRFAQFSPFGKGIMVDLVHIHPSEGGRKTSKASKSRLLVQQAAAFLRAHGFEHVVETSQEGEDPARRLVDHARETGANLIVAGAHSVSAARRLAFGSTTHTLLQDCDLPLFLFH